VDDLLDVVRVMTGKIVLKMEALDFAATVRQAVWTLSTGGVLQRHKVALQLAPASVRGDESRVEQIVTNLLINAGKYTPPGGSITVTVEERDGQAVLRVRDTGLGLDKDLLPVVFDLFVQGGRTLDRSQGGLGIGLSLVKRLVELHGGTITARSDGPGTGSEFEVRLPAIAAVQPVANAPEVERSPGRDVLIVEDNDDAREMLKIMLELGGHKVQTARDGKAGVEAALQTRPEIALIDIGLPGLNGYEVAREIRGRFNGAIRLVAITGYGMPDDELRAKEAGFDEHLIKPVDWQQLTRVLGAGDKPE
jgi:two-component system, sensor histidine kinase